MPEIHRIGAHITWIEHSLIDRAAGAGLSGGVSVEDAEAINVRHFALIEDRAHIFMLVDMAGLRTDTPAGRKLTSEALTRMPLHGLAISHAHLEARVMAKMVITGSELFKTEDSGKFPVKFFDDEPAARAWIAERRQALA